MEMNKKHFYVAIDGNIGCGKTTLLKNLTFNENFKIIPEPVEAFSSFKQYNPLLSMYQDPVKNASCAQMHIIDTSQKYYQTKVAQSQKPYNISERCIFSPSIFIEAKKEMKELTSFCADYIHTYHDNLISKNQIFPDKIIFLHCEPNISKERIQKRNQDPTTPLISLEYLYCLDKQFRKFYCNDKINPLIIDTSVKTPDDVTKLALNYIFSEEEKWRRKEKEKIHA